MTRLFATSLAGLLACAAASALADVVILRNGVTMEGILAPGRDGTAVLQVSDAGFVELDTSTIVSARAQTAAENAALQEKWAAERRRQDAEDRAARELADKKRASGLVLDGEDWITPAELDRRLAREELAVERARAAPPPPAPIVVSIVVPQAAVYDFVGLRLDDEDRRPFPARTRSLPRLNEFSSSGNFIRRSEFARPSAHDGKTFDPATGLYR